MICLKTDELGRGGSKFDGVEQAMLHFLNSSTVFLLHLLHVVKVKASFIKYGVEIKAFQEQAMTLLLVFLI